MIRSHLKRPINGRPAIRAKMVRQIATCVGLARVFPSVTANLNVYLLKERTTAKGRARLFLTGHTIADQRKIRISRCRDLNGPTLTTCPMFFMRFS